MKLTKENVCVFVKDEAQIKEATEMLDKYGERISDYVEFEINCRAELNYLQFSNNPHIKGWWLAAIYESENFIEITLQQLEEILKQSK